MSTASQSEPNLTGSEAPVVIVGAGPVGIFAAREILGLAPKQPLVIYGAEAWEPYNRVRLSELLAGVLEWEEIANPLDLLVENNASLRINTPIVRLDRARKIVTTAAGEPQPYSHLILATGSTPHRPNLKNSQLLGVYTYRNVDDAQELLANCIQSQSTVVLGGGVLGVEVAYALKAQNPQTGITILHRSERLMNRQLQPEASAALMERVRETGMVLRFGNTVAELVGNSELRAVLLESGERIECDTLVICTGIDPDMSLARDAGLRVARGVKVNDFMQTSDPAIYAIGECAEHRGRAYALLGPGIEQASVAVRNVLFGNTTEYHGSQRSMRVKVIDVPVFVLERPADLRSGRSRKRWVTYRNEATKVMRALNVSRGRVIGATAIGDWPELAQMQEAITENRRIWPWETYRFLRDGTLWPPRSAQDPATWPPEALVCTCAGVTRRQLSQALTEGYTSVKALCERTGAAQACGSCLPLVSKMTGAPVVVETGRRLIGALAAASVAAAVASIALLAWPRISPPSTVRESPFPQLLWSEGSWQQASGYAILGLVLLSLGIALRKRWSEFRLGDFPAWRVVHVVLVTLALPVLMVHTGMRLGEAFNLKLMLAFLAVVASGLILGGILIMDERSSSPRMHTLRAGWVKIHLILMWLLFALIPLHVLAVYYY